MAHMAMWLLPGFPDGGIAGFITHGRTAAAIRERYAAGEGVVSLLSVVCARALCSLVPNVSPVPPPLLQVGCYPRFLAQWGRRVACWLRAPCRVCGGHAHVAGQVWQQPPARVSRCGRGATETFGRGAEGSCGRRQACDA
jgi:hypothetical protein